MYTLVRLQHFHWRNPKDLLTIFCFSFSHVARYAPSYKTKTSGTIDKNPSQTNIESTYNYFLRLLFVSSTNERFIDAKKCNYTPFLDAKKIDFTPFLGAKNIRISLIYGVKKNKFRTFSTEKQPHTIWRNIISER